MTLRDHVLLGTAGAAVAAAVSGAPQAAAFWLASIFIDVDHYVHYLHHNGYRDFDPRRMWRYHMLLFDAGKRGELLALCVCHSVEFVTLWALAAWWRSSPVLWAAFAGLMFHLALDVGYLQYHGILKARAHSFVSFYIRRARLRQQGLDPEVPIQAAIRAVAA